MIKKFLEAGKIVNTHGVRGEVKIQTWTNSPDFLCQFNTLYIDEKPHKINSIKPHKQSLIASLESITDFDGAIRLKNKIIYIDRDEIELSDGTFFIQDLIGLDVLDDGTGQKIGTLKEILDLPKNNVYVIQAESEILVPAVPEFIKEVNIDGGYIKVAIIEGM